MNSQLDQHFRQYGVLITCAVGLTVFTRQNLGLCTRLRTIIIIVIIYLEKKLDYLNE